MKITVIPPERVPQFWGLVRGYLASALEYCDGEYDVEHVRVYLATGQWMLLVAEDGGVIKGAAAVNFFNRPTGRVAFIVAIGGRLVSNQDTFAQMSEIFRSYGATHVEGAARESVARLWTRYGLKEKYRIVGVAL